MAQMARNSASLSAVLLQDPVAVYFAIAMPSQGLRGLHRNTFAYAMYPSAAGMEYAATKKP